MQQAFYRFDEAMSWFESAEALVFVGTSFSVNITSLALTQARKRGLAVFNFNLRDALNGKDKRYQVHNVLGLCEEKLSKLVDLVTALKGASDGNRVRDQLGLITVLP